MEALYKLYKWVNEKNKGKLPVFSKNTAQKEKTMARRYARLNNKYMKYMQDPTLIDDLDEEKQDEIEEILSIGKQLDMFYEEINIDDPNDGKISGTLDTFMSEIEIKGHRRKFLELLENSSVKQYSYLENARAIRAWMEEHNTIKPPSTTSKDEEEKRLGQALSTIRRSIIKPYNELKTEEEKSNFREKHPYIDEIIYIVAELDLNYGNKRSQKVAMLLRQDLEKRHKLEEVKKLEQKYEQELVNNKEKNPDSKRGEFNGE